MKLTEEEKIILKNTDKKWRYIARDNNGNLYLYEEPPFKSYLTKIWCHYISHYLHAFIHLFQSVQWTDDEPLEFRNDKGEFIL